MVSKPAIVKSAQSRPENELKRTYQTPILFILNDILGSLGLLFKSFVFNKIGSFALSRKL